MEDVYLIEDILKKNSKFYFFMLIYYNKIILSFQIVAIVFIKFVKTTLLYLYKSIKQQ